MRKYIYIFLGCLLITYLNAHAQTGPINFTSAFCQGRFAIQFSRMLSIKDRCGLMWFATDDEFE